MAASPECDVVSCSYTSDESHTREDGRIQLLLLLIDHIIVESVRNASSTHEAKGKNDIRLIFHFIAY